jgi:hypothetical protein
LEFLLDNPFGDFLNQWYMKFIWNKYTKKHGHQFSAKDLEIMFKSKDYVSKVHPGHYQKRLLNRITAMQQSFEEKFHVQLVNK